MSWAALFAFWGAFALALMSPGPNFAFLLRSGLGAGRATALRATLGIAVGEAVWGFAALFGVAALALRYPLLTTAIRWAGGAFLLWLAWGALRSAWRGPATTGETSTAKAGGGFWTGLVLMLLNVKAAFFWVSLTSVLLGTDLAPRTAFLIVTVCVLLSLLWHGVLALAFSGQRVTRLYARAQRSIEGVLGAALAALGLRLLAPG